MTYLDKPVLSVEEFRKIRDDINNRINNFSQELDNDPELLNITDKVERDNLEEKKTMLFLEKEYFPVIDNLRRYNLSNIPAIEWENFIFFGWNEFIFDLSNTGANIDFNILESFIADYYNFKGCNVENVDKCPRLNEDSFDLEVLDRYSELFLSDLFTGEIKEKYHKKSLRITDFVNMSFEQLNELKKKNIEAHLSFESKRIVELIELDKLIALYNYSQDDYNSFLEMIDILKIEESKVKSILENTGISDIKNACYKFCREKIINGDYSLTNVKYPQSFIDDNPDIFLVDANIPDEARERYYNRELTIRDLITFPDVFQRFPIDYFIDFRIDVARTIRENYGMGKFQELLQKHNDVFVHLEDNFDFYNFSSKFRIGKDLETDFIKAVKGYFCSYYMDDEFRINADNVYVPDWLKSMNFKFVDKLKSPSDLMQYDDSIVVMDDDQRRVLDMFGIENIRHFEEETGFFSHKSYQWSHPLESFGMFCSYCSISNRSSYKLFEQTGIDFKNGSLSYDEFLEQLAKLFDHMRRNNVFTDFTDYDWIRGKFRNDHPELFIDEKASFEFREAFYRNRITADFLYENKKIIPFLVDKNLSNTLNINMWLQTADEKPVDFIKEYTSRYGNLKLLELVARYGEFLSDITIPSFNNEIENEQDIEKALREAIYKKIEDSRMSYSYLAKVPEFVAEYPEIFVDFNSISSLTEEEKKKLTKNYYVRYLTFEDIRKHPELIPILKNKNLFLAFKSRYGDSLINGASKGYSELDLLRVFGNEKFLELCSMYGRYMDDITKHFKGLVEDRERPVYVDNRGVEISFDKIKKIIEDIIIKESILGNIDYKEDDAPSFLREKSPELFLDDGAPEQLRKYFYNNYNGYPLTFELLHAHKADWLPHLEGKSIKTALLRNGYLKEKLSNYFQIFGDEKAIKLGINRAETVTRMVEADQVELMKRWYDKTGGKFIPDFVVMQNFSLEEADKFLESGSNWSQLMRIKNFAESPEARDAMLKLAYSFGVFDHDQRGFKKLQDLLTDLPRKITSDKAYIIDSLDEYLINTKLLNDLVILLKKEKVDIDFSKPIFSQIYRKNEDGSCSLTINPQNCQESVQIIRNILGNYRELPIVTPEKAHQLFGAFELKYDPDFREFLLANMEEILGKPEYATYISSIQRQFSEIKAINSNRFLTLDLAISYVKTNKFESINIGNERVAEISAIAGYSQDDFNILQQIYNYGKQRVFSSIPRVYDTVEKKTGKYTYEMLRLADPLAMAIGTLSDCCQELHDAAEVCMEHSMVDKNGRVFVIKDEEGNIVSQSWVWRNEDVLCFDNIEIPEKAFARVSREHPEFEKDVFADEIFEIYKQAAHDLMEKDEKVYKELLESGKITQDQYYGLRLGKITVGLGYNDIAQAIKKNSKSDRFISRPLPFEPPVKLSRGLYTRDSNSQYILEERDDRGECDSKTIAVHSDDYTEYDDSTFTEKDLLALEKLEIITKNDPMFLETSLRDDVDKEHLVTALARNYRINPNTTRIIKHPNFAIIYDINDDIVRIADLFFNTKVDNGSQQLDIEDKVLMQIKLALEQIAKDKSIDISDLSSKQKEMYEKAISLSEELDTERGLNNAR